MFQDLVNYIQTSETATYAFAFSILTPLAWKIPNVLLSGFNWVKSKLYFTCDIHYSDASFNDFNSWLLENKESIRFNRKYRLRSGQDISTWDTRASGANEKWGLTTSYGTCLLKPKGFHWMMMTRTKDDSKKDLVMPADTISLTSMLWKKNELNNFLESVRKSQVRPSDKYIYISNGDYFQRIKKIKKDYNDKLLPKQFLDVLESIKDFFDSEQWYVDSGIPYKKGYMLYGIPGTGKSKAAVMISDMLNRDLYMVRGEDITNIGELTRTVPEGSVILIEEIDTVGMKARENNSESEEENDEDADKGSKVVEVPKKNSEYSSYLDDMGNFMLSKLLNSLDGVISYRGSVLIATTNHIEKIDHAVLRAGRFDVHSEFKAYEPDLVAKCFKSFYNYDGNVECNKECTIAKINSVFMEFKTKKEEAAKKLNIRIL